MKRSIPYAVMTGLLAASIALASCDAPPIFAAIEEEVALKDPSVRGIVSSMVIVPDGRSGEGMKYASNGRVYKKSGSSGSWDEVSLPAYRCRELAYDGVYVYGLMTGDDAIATAGVFYLDPAAGNGWTKIAGTDGMERVLSGNGFVYGFTAAGTGGSGTFEMYHLTAGGTGAALATGLAKPTSSAVADYDAGTGVSWFATLGGVYPADGSAPLTGGPTTGVLAMTASDGGLLFAATSSTLHMLNGAAWTSITHKGTQSGVASLAWLPRGSDSGVVLLGGGKTEGYSEVTVTALPGTPALTTVQWPGSQTLSSVAPGDQSQYDNSVGLWTVGAVFADASAAGTGSNDYVIYAGVVNDKGYDGLWGYYPQTRSEWNRE